MMFTETITRIRIHITQLFSTYNDPRLVYHNLDHSTEVAARAREIGNCYKLSEENMFTLQTAALFHDTGYFFIQGKGHEEKSAGVFQQSASQLGIEQPLVAEISRVILATSRQYEPVRLLDEIICDADTYHFGTAAFRITNNLVKREFELLSGNPLPNWTRDSLALLTQHRFHTSYCRMKLEDGKKQNILWLQNQL